ncbi:MAG: pseudouridine synthase [Amphritea sp.]
MSIAPTPSVVCMPQDSQGCLVVLDFLVRKFPQISRDVWLQRMQDGNVHWDDGTLITKSTPYVAQKRISYYREVAQEPVIPFTETILFQDDELLVACKPHFLPVTPGGIYVQECLLNRLRRSTGIKTLAPIHRIDRETAGIVMFSVNPDHRGCYQQLFANRQVRKHYHAIAPIVICEDASTGANAGGEEACSDALIGRQWLIESRMVKGEPRFRMRTVDGDINARSTIKCVDVRAGRGFFHLSPLTGKTHQLRVHMSELGYPLENDRFYTELQPRVADDYQRPLQLLAKQIEFTDPLSGERRYFQTDRCLNW